MRVTREQLGFIKSSIITIRPNAHVYLFGSRVYDDKKGGDIDILILSNINLSVKEKGQIRRNFYSEFGEQKLDLISFTFEEKSSFKDLILLDAIEI